jgi:hypothetical protein
VVILSGQWGGARNWKFESSEEELKVSSLCLQFVERNPTCTLKVLLLKKLFQDCVDFCADFGYDVDEMWVSRLFQRMDYTIKVVSHKQVHLEVCITLVCALETEIHRGKSEILCRVLHCNVGHPC